MSKAKPTVCQERETGKEHLTPVESQIQFVAIAGSWCSVQGASVLWHPPISSGKHQKPQAAVCLKEQEGLKALTAAYNPGKAGNFPKQKFPDDPSISFDHYCKYQNFVPHVICVLGQLENWCPPMLEWRGWGELPGILWPCWCLQQPHFHAVHRRRCCFFSFFSPLFLSFLPVSLLITEANGCCELRGGFIAQLHGGGAWFSLCSAGYQF